MIRSTLLLAMAGLAGCRSYTPLDLQLAAHAAAFTERHATLDERTEFALDDGITRSEGRALALMFHPDCRHARHRAQIARASAEHAGKYDDPVLAADFEKILENVTHPWLLGGALELTLPLSGRKAREREVADTQHFAALIAAHQVEQDVTLAVDHAWLRWQAQSRRVAAMAEMLQRVEGLEAIANRLLASGEVTRPEARVFTLEKVTRTDEHLAAQADARLAAMTIYQLIGVHPEAPVTLIDEEPAVASIHAMPQPTVEDYLSSPRAWQLSAEFALSEADLELEIARQWPELMLGPGYGEEDGEPRLTLGIALPLPLWNRNARAIETSTAERAAAAAALRRGYEQFVHDLAMRQQRHDAAAAHRIRVEDDLVPLAEQQLADSRTLAERGMVDPLLLLDSLTRAHDAHLARITAQLEQELSSLDLQALLWIVPPVQPILER